jgi:hypothetical protein
MLPDILRDMTANMPPEVRAELSEFTGRDSVLAWLGTLPLPDPAVVRRYLSGPTVTSVTVDARGMWLHSLGQ